MTLSEYRKVEGLTLTQLAERLGRPLGTVHGWLNADGRHGRLPDVGVLAETRGITGGKVTPADLRPDLAALFGARPRVCRKPSHASQDAGGRDGVQAS